MVKDYTRSQYVDGVLRRSLIGHCYTQMPERIIGPFTEAVGDSDRLGVRAQSYVKVELINYKLLKSESINIPV